MKYTKQDGIKHIKSRLYAINHWIDFTFKQGNFYFRPRERGIEDLSYNSFGRLCEIGYIVSICEITKEEFSSILKDVGRRGFRLT